MASNIDPTKPTATSALTSDVRANFSAAKTEIEALQTDKANLADLASTTNGAGKGFHLVYIERTDAEVSAGVTPTNYEYPEGHVWRYGAQGDDGVTDDLTAISNAIASASYGNGNVYIPRSENGDYYGVSDYIPLKSNVRIEWEPNAFIKLTAPSSVGHVLGPAVGESLTNITLMHPHIDGGSQGYVTAQTNGENGIGITRTEDLTIIGGLVKNCRRGTNNTGGKGIQVELTCKNVLVDGTRIQNCTKGFNTQGSDPGTDAPATNIIFDNIIVEDCWQIFELDEFLSPAAQSRDITNVVIGNVIAKNCGIKDYSGGTDTGAFVIQRYAYAKIGNVMLTNETTYGTIPAFGVVHRSENIHGNFSFFGDCTVLLDMEDNASFGTNAADGNTLNIISILHSGSVGTLVNSNSGGSATLYDDNSIDIICNDSTATIMAGVLTSSNTHISARELTTNKHVFGRASHLTTLSISDFSGSQAVQCGDLSIRFGYFGTTTGTGEDRLSNLQDADVLFQRNGSTRLILKSTTLNIPTIPTSSAGLSAGDIWSNSGVLTIV